MRDFRLYTKLFVIVAILLISIGCGSERKEIQEHVSELPEAEIPEFAEDVYEEEVRKIMSENQDLIRDLDDIKKDGVLKAVTVYSSTSYFLYKGQPMGFEFELLEKLSEHLDLELDIIVAKNVVDVLKILYEGKADLVAYGFAATEKRREYVDFTDPLFLSHQVLVQRKPENWRKMKLHEIDEALIRNNIELIGQTVSVRPRSSYIRRLDNLMEEIGDEIFIDTVPINTETEELIRMVVDGEIKYTVADYNVASLNASYYPELDIRVPISFSQRIAWALRKSSPDLKEAINSWLEKIKRTPDFNVIYNKYFEKTRDYRKRIRDDYFSPETGKISPYDDLIKKYAADLGWDWRLLSSQVYQESQFDPKAKSWAGAQGLLQVMPATAKEYGVSNSANPEKNIQGATKLLAYLWSRWESIPDTVQRIKFTMAS
jgi:membrane-bound lytic murein transglycosylase F